MIPAFNLHGIVPPIRPGADGHSPDRAPYRTDLRAFCQRFGETPERRAILRGFLGLREALRSAGIAEGFQWLDGSFTEDIERLRGRPPADIDVVTFAVLGNASEQRARANASPQLFDGQHVKSTYHVDHYFVQMDQQAFDDSYVRRVAYWYSMWAHQRDTERWKGFVTVPLQSNDLEAGVWLRQHAISDGTP